jgi:hypothetical protein
MLFINFVDVSWGFFITHLTLEAFFVSFLRC